MVEEICEDERRTRELAKLMRQPFYTNLEPILARKLALLTDDDLFPAAKSEEASTGCLGSLFEKPDEPSEQKIKRNSLKLKRAKIACSSQHGRSIIKTENISTILIAQPIRIEFRNFIPGRIYKVR